MSVSPGEGTEPPPGVGTPLFADSQALLDLSVRFYGAQRSGDGQNWLLEGASCHLNDGESIQAELSGGWYDAGDHVKVTLSIAYASYVMLKAYDAYASSFRDLDDDRHGGVPNGIPDVLDQARYATDYLVKAHISEGELVGMVGNATADHRRWVTCVEQETLTPELGGNPRPVSLDANADVAGITAGSLAIMARLYEPFDPALAQSYRQHAEQIYQIGINNPMGSNPGLYGQRGEAWVDEMLCGAAELYRATGVQTYLDEALAFNDRVENHGWAPNYSQAADFCRHSLYVGGASEAVAEYWRLDVENYASHVSTNELTRGLVFFDDWGSLRYAAGASFSAALYSEVTGDVAARTLALGQLNYIMGDNSYGRSFVVGFGTNPPQQPHHRNAQGHEMTILPFEHTISGALVGGPSNEGGGVTAPGYTDDVNDYVSNEVALDYNAGLVGLAAFGAREQAGL
jgi:endoglucanase